MPESWPVPPLHDHSCAVFMCLGCGGCEFWSCQVTAACHCPLTFEVGM